MQETKTRKKLEFIQDQVRKIISKAEELEAEYNDSISQVYAVYRESALNLLHYLAFRSFDIGDLQQRLRYMGLPDLANIEGHVMKSLLTIQAIINHFLKYEVVNQQKSCISIKKSEKLLRKNTKLLFGNKSNKRQTRIMVTLPFEAAENYRLVNQLLPKLNESDGLNLLYSKPENLHAGTSDSNILRT